ncbi:LLM class flavin-dependent oxidoreductase [Halobacillus sp. A5]|uniref:LLM class flavin-dependent oxidoreductase n=1 Tax=Halobacillus sp. A5 TaxID=2880263 RepID=UPI0020A681F2|nr:LLM class flavin-dependent oxidoreductase [Halobacillus sp. A5]MCP3029261.1 LLM class flavin-dependent oxidoreductase [Halobacillus sp. A5]
MKLSVLDQSPILSGSTPEEAFQQTTELAKRTDELGFHRFWAAEHHSTKGLAGSSPEILAAHLASQTSRIRIGTGGILLPHYSPYKIAEVFRVLETLYPGRIDLGVGRSPGGVPNVNLALNRGQIPSIEDYPKQLSELLSYLYGEDPHGMGIFAAPKGESSPPIWMLGSSGTSARVASELGVSYSFAHFINGHGGSRAMNRYFDYFHPSVQQKEPHGNVSIFAVCAETDEHAEFLASSLDLAILKIEQGGLQRSFPTPDEALDYSYSVFEEQQIQDNRNRMVVGSPGKVKEEIEWLAHYYNVDEVIINTIVSPFEDRLKSYQLIAEAFQLNKE